MLIKNALSENQKVIIVNAEVINHIQYAVDTDPSQENLQIILDNVIENCEEAGIDLNIQNTKFLIVSKQQNI